MHALRKIVAEPEIHNYLNTLVDWEGAIIKKEEQNLIHISWIYLQLH